LQTRYSSLICLVVLLSAWIILAYNTSIMKQTTQFQNVIGYVVLPLTLFFAWRVVFAFANRSIKITFTSGRYLAYAGIAAISYGIFYMFATNMIAPPDEFDPILKSSFIVPYQNFGPLAMWPNLEFYLKSVNLAGFVSVGSMMTVLTLSGMMGLVVALFLYNVNYMTSKAGATTSSSMFGAILSSLSTNTCCCCSPAILPAVLVFFGSATANSFWLEFSTPSSLAFNLALLLNLGLLLLSIIISSKRIEKMVTCKSSDDLNQS